MLPMMRKLLLCNLFVSSALALGLGTLIAPRPALAATFAIDSQDDTRDATAGDGECANADGRCTLRAAVEEANRLPGPDVILLPAGTYMLNLEGNDEDRCATGDLDITSSLAITGEGAATTIIDANHRDRVFDVRATGAAVITGVTVRNGSAPDGAGIRIEGGTLRLLESAVSDNQAGDNGGGIDNDFGELEVLRSTLSGNVAHNSGGGLANSGTATLANVTLSGNTADIVGGGLCNLGTATLNNATVSANTMAGLDNDGQLVLMNTILAGNAGADCQGTLTSRGFNLIANPSGCAFDGDTSGNLIDMEANLGPLQDNGGPTLTHALLTDSAALDAANPADPGSGEPACEETDQRGVTRPQGARCDIGAFEACVDSGSADAAFTGCVAVCGDGVVDANEECDNGTSNGAPDDPCDATCDEVPSSSIPGPTCGDGIEDADEDCDDGNQDDNDGCSSGCELEEPLDCDESLCDHGGCDPASRFKAINCVLESPVCKDESMPIGVIKRIAKARDVLARAWRTQDPHRERMLVVKAVRTLKKAARIRAGVVRRGGLSPECAAALDEMLDKALGQCRGWLSSF